MLSRTADHLFWMARYVERAENTARMLDVTFQNDLLSPTEGNAEEHWRAMLNISELYPTYTENHGAITAKGVLEFMVRDASNLSSIYSCLRAARENARAVRGALTTELWETHNSTWLGINKRLDAGMLENDPGEFLEWVKFRSHLSRGVMIGTMLKDESFHFGRLGTFLERADNTARILDVKYQGLSDREKQIIIQHDEDENPQQRDFYHWASLLRSVSAFEIYRKVYRHAITPEHVAELLILRSDMPRSLAACLDEIVVNLQHVSNSHSQETERRAGLLQAELRFGRIDDIFKSGLHTWLTRFLEQVNDLGSSISHDFLTFDDDKGLNQSQ